MKKFKEVRLCLYIFIVSTLFLVNGCGTFYSVSPATKPDKIVVKKVTSKTGKTEVFATGYSVNNYLYADEKNLYMWMYDRDMRQFEVHGILHSFTKTFRNRTELNNFLANLQKLRPQHYDTGFNYHIYIPQYDLYVRYYRHIPSMTPDVVYIVYEYTDSYQNDPLARKILKSITKQNNIKQELATFGKYYRLENLTGPKTKWTPDTNNDSLHMNGYGTLFTYAPNKTGAARVYIHGKFENGILVNDGNIELKQYRCLERGILMCKKSYDAIYKDVLNRRDDLKTEIDKGLKELERYLDKKEAEVTQTSSRNSSALDCDEMNHICTQHCEGKSDASGFFSNSAKQSCRMGCQYAYDSCGRVEKSTALSRFCSAMCEGLKKTNGAMIFGTSDFDTCTDNCYFKYRD